MMRRAFFLLPVLLGALAALAQLESVNALMFFDDPGGRLPACVPPGAYYDGSPTNKELRVTTNVASAVWSMASALLERQLMAGSRSTHRPDDLASYYTTMPFEPPLDVAVPPPDEVYKTNNLYRYGFSTAFAPFADATNRVISTYRVAKPGLLAAVRAELRHIADEPGWGAPGGAFAWGSSLLMPGAARTLPAFDWTRDDVLDMLADDEWAAVCPEIACCRDDGAWKLSPYEGSPQRFYGGFLEFFAGVGGATNASRRAVVSTALVPATAFSIVTNRFGERSGAFTNDTLRLSYYGLGTLEHALGAVDTTYSAPGSFGGPDFKCYRVSYYNIRGSDCSGLDLAYDGESRSVVFPREYNWSDGGEEPHAGVSAGTSYDPFVWADGSIDEGLAGLWAFAEDGVTAGDLAGVWADYEVDTQTSGFDALDIIPREITGDTYEFDVVAVWRGSTDIYGPTNTLSRLMPTNFAGEVWCTVDRTMAAGFTSGEWATTNGPAGNVYPRHLLDFPSDLAWRLGVVAGVDLVTAETREVVTNCSISTGITPSWSGGGAMTNEWRSVATANLASLGALAVAGSHARAGHHAAVVALAPWQPPADPGAAAGALPIPANALSGLKSLVEGVGSVPVAGPLPHGTSDDVHRLRIFPVNPPSSTSFAIQRLDRSGRVVSTSYVDWQHDAEFFSFIASDSYNRPVPEVSRVPSFHAHGAIAPFLTTRWRFQSLRAR